MMPQNHPNLQPLGRLLRICHSRGIQELSKDLLGVCSTCDPFCFAVRTNQAPGTLLVGTSPNVKPAHWKKLLGADLFVRMGPSKWFEYPRGIVGWHGVDGVWGTILEDGELYWFRFVGRHGLWRDRFLGGNIGLSRRGNSFKMEHWARKIISSE